MAYGSHLGKRFMWWEAGVLDITDWFTNGAPGPVTKSVIEEHVGHAADLNFKSIILTETAIKYGADTPGRFLLRDNPPAWANYSVVPHDGLRWLMDACSARAMTVYLGVGGRMGRDDLMLKLSQASRAGRSIIGTAEGAAFNETVAGTQEMAQRLYGAFGKHPALAGWYIPHEVCDMNALWVNSWFEAVNKHAYFGFPSLQSYGLEIMESPMPSAFRVGNDSDAAIVAGIKQRGSHIISLQDAVGGGDAKENIPAVFSRMKRLCEQANVEFLPEMEIWQMKNPLLNYADSYPADVERVAYQLREHQRITPTLAVYAGPQYLYPPECRHKPQSGTGEMYLNDLAQADWDGRATAIYAEMERQLGAAEEPAPTPEPAPSPFVIDRIKAAQRELAMALAELEEAPVS